MSHHLVSDQNYLAALAESDIPYIGLLGPAPRRARLMSEIGDKAREAGRPPVRADRPRHRREDARDHCARDRERNPGGAGRTSRRTVQRAGRRGADRDRTQKRNSLSTVRRTFRTVSASTRSCPRRLCVLCVPLRSYSCSQIFKGSVRSRWPVAANTAFAIAGAIGGTPGSPSPPIGASDDMNSTVISGASASFGMG